ncbi:MAG: redoxin domain-containing protein [Candidatus Acidiferrum sp.]
MTNIVPGNRAPDFSLRALNGAEYSLSKQLDCGPVVAAFFKVSCPVCQFTFPFLERLFLRYGRDSVTFLGISQDEARATRKFAEQYGVTFPMLLDENKYATSRAYGLTSVPTVFLLDHDGTIKIASAGFDKKSLENIAAEMAQRQKLPPAALFRADERVPEYKPG